MSEKRELKIITGNPKESGAEGTGLSALVQIQAPEKGKAYWRSLDEIAETPEFTSVLHREFPQSASEWDDPQGRRRFLKLMGASIALAGLSSAACSVQPEEKIIPYVRQPEEFIP